MSRKTWTIPANRWHARAYNNWLVFATSKKPSQGYQENLCHYWRVVVFWSWWTRFWTWFLEAKTVEDPTNRNDRIPPGIPVLGIILVAVAAGALYSSHSWQLATFFFIGTPLLIAGVLFAGYLSYEKYEDIRYGNASPNVLFETLLAKKHKICPLIEVEKDEELV